MINQPQQPVEVILLKQLASHLATPIFVVDPEGNLLYFNEPAEDILARRYDETGQLPVAEWSTIFTPVDHVTRLRVRWAIQLPVPAQVPVGTNLADVERWMIFATLQKCCGNKTRAAALLGVSLKTLYNRLNAYRAQGLVMDYAATAGRDIEITGLHADLTGELTEAL